MIDLSILQLLLVGFFASLFNLVNTELAKYLIDKWKQHIQRKGIEKIRTLAKH